MTRKTRPTFEEELELRAQDREARSKAEGKAEVCRAFLCKLLERRFGPLSHELRQAIEATVDVERLRACFDQAIDIPALDGLSL